MSGLPHYRKCLNISRAERSFKKALNSVDWSQVPIRRIDRALEMLEAIRNQRYDQFDEDEPLYADFGYTDSEYDSDSSTNEDEEQSFTTGVKRRLSYPDRFRNRLPQELIHVSVESSDDETTTSKGKRPIIIPIRKRHRPDDPRESTSKDAATDADADADNTPPEDRDV